ncbi:hypothetical protein EDD22DRAFT_776334 [Suillus occidentalis]|nr:hypothetical protein EDD22DRAFT_776334 [Suillus occidentalis]
MLVIHPASCCDVCLDPYSIPSGPAHSPHAIACGHIFCLTCLRSLSLSACPLCREPFKLEHVKRLYLANPLRRDNVEQDPTDDRHASLLHHMSLVSSDDTSDAEVAKAITEVQEWLKAQSGDSNSVRPFHRAAYTGTCCFLFAVFLAHSTSSCPSFPPANQSSSRSERARKSRM